MSCRRSPPSSAWALLGPTRSPYNESVSSAMPCPGPGPSWPTSARMASSSFCALFASASAMWRRSSERWRRTSRSSLFWSTSWCASSASSTQTLSWFCACTMDAIRCSRAASSLWTSWCCVCSARYAASSSRTRPSAARESCGGGAPAARSAGLSSSAAGGICGFGGSESCAGGRPVAWPSGFLEIRLAARRACLMAVPPAGPPSWRFVVSGARRAVPALARRSSTRNCV
mmetsp:Transcript_86766/g.246063  ORF Transcript_86766/g.246063 Transcript_86766/m.246063 type:complete len:230 (+) Transcript_86766:293-982(+)